VVGGLCLGWISDSTLDSRHYLSKDYMKKSLVCTQADI
jgi:hypothetical protein